MTQMFRKKSLILNPIFMIFPGPFVPDSGNPDGYFDSPYQTVPNMPNPASRQRDCWGSQDLGESWPPHDMRHSMNGGGQPFGGMHHSMGNVLDQCNGNTPHIDVKPAIQAAALAGYSGNLAVLTLFNRLILN